MIEVFYRPNMSNYEYKYYTDNKILDVFTLDIKDSGVTYHVNESETESRIDFFNRRKREFYLTYNFKNIDFRLHTVSYSFRDFSLYCGFNQIDRITHLTFVLTKYKSSESTQTLKYSLNDYQVFFDGVEVRPDQMISEVLTQVKRNIS